MNRSNRIISGFVILILIFIAFLFLSCKNAGIEDPEPMEPLLYEVVSRTYLSTVFNTIVRPIRICLPSDYDALTELLPVLYLLHGAGGYESSWINEGNIVEKLSNLYGNESIPPMIVVTTANLPIGSNFMGVGPDGDPFVREFVTDIIPFIEEMYRVSPDSRIIAGLSFGGLFAAHVLFTEPELFQGYIMSGTPFVWDDRALWKTEAEYFANSQHLPAVVFSAIGEFEDPERLLKPWREFTAHLMSREYKGLRFKAVEFKEETHISVWPAAFTRGLKFVLSTN